MIKSIVCLLATAALLATGCSTHTANLDMSEFKSEMLFKTGSWDGQEIGYVSGSEGGFIWSECTETARVAVHALITNAKAKGANAVGNIKWKARGTPEASCKKGWGWFALWPFVLTPLFMSTEVSGTAYKVNDSSAKKSGMLMLPTNSIEEAAFIDAVITL